MEMMIEESTKKIKYDVVAKLVEAEMKQILGAHTTYMLRVYTKKSLCIKIVT